MSKKARRLKGILVRPKGQMKLALFFALSAVAALAVESGMFVKYLMIVRPQGDQSMSFSSYFFSILLFMVGICLISATFTFALGIVYSHRFFGPLVPLLRQIRALKEGDYSKRGQLRKTDELKEIMAELNELASVLAATAGQR